MAHSTIITKLTAAARGGQSLAAERSLRSSPGNNSNSSAELVALTRVCLDDWLVGGSVTVRGLQAGQSYVLYEYQQATITGACRGLRQKHPAVSPDTLLVSACL